LLHAQRVDAAKPRIQSLNPLVQVDVISDAGTLYENEILESLIREVDMVILTDSDRTTIVCHVEDLVLTVLMAHVLLSFASMNSPGETPNLSIAAARTASQDTSSSTC